MQIDQRVVVVAHFDRHVGGAEQNGIDWQTFKAAVVGRQVTLALEVAQICIQSRSITGQARGQTGVDVQRHAAAFLERKIALNEEKATNAQQSVVERDADQGAVVIKHKIGISNAEVQARVAVTADEINEGAHALNPFPVAALVQPNLQAFQLELKQYPVDFNVGIPVHL